MRKFRLSKILLLVLLLSMTTSLSSYAHAKEVSSSNQIGSVSVSTISMMPILLRDGPIVNYDSSFDKFLEKAGIYKGSSTEPIETDEEVELEKDNWVMTLIKEIFVSLPVWLGDLGFSLLEPYQLDIDSVILGRIGAGDEMPLTSFAFVEGNIFGELAQLYHILISFMSLMITPVIMVGLILLIVMTADSKKRAGYIDSIKKTFIYLMFFNLVPFLAQILFGIRDVILYFFYQASLLLSGGSGGIVETFKNNVDGSPINAGLYLGLVVFSFVLVFNYVGIALALLVEFALLPITALISLMPGKQKLMNEIFSEILANLTTPIVDALVIGVASYFMYRGAPSLITIGIILNMNNIKRMIKRRLGVESRTGLDAGGMIAMMGMVNLTRAAMRAGRQTVSSVAGGIGGFRQDREEANFQDEIGNNMDSPTTAPEVSRVNTTGANDFSSYQSFGRQGVSSMQGSSVSQGSSVYQGSTLSQGDTTSAGAERTSSYEGYGEKAVENGEGTTRQSSLSQDGARRNSSVSTKYFNDNASVSWLDHPQKNRMLEPHERAQLLRKRANKTLRTGIIKGAVTAGVGVYSGVAGAAAGSWLGTQGMMAGATAGIAVGDMSGDIAGSISQAQDPHLYLKDNAVKGSLDVENQEFQSDMARIHAEYESTVNSRLQEEFNTISQEVSGFAVEEQAQAFHERALEAERRIRSETLEKLTDDFGQKFKDKLVENDQFSYTDKDLEKATSLAKKRSEESITRTEQSIEKVYKMQG